MELLQSLFEQQARIVPSQLALSTSQRKITYRALSNYSNQVARRLLQLSVKKNTLVAIVMEKGWEQVVAVLGILKAGAAYLPVDAGEFPERLTHLLQIGEVNYVLTQKKYQSTLTWPSQVQAFAIDEETEWLDISTESLPIMQTSEDLAYVIFTSGTTGVPKGVMINHRGAVNTILDINQRFQVKKTDRILAVSALHFDLSVYDIFGMLAVGGTIVMPSGEESRDPSRWPSLFLKEKISILNCVPALMQIFVEHLSIHVTKNILINHSLRLVLLSGDWIPITLPNKIKSLFGHHVETISLGGATEASIWSIIYAIRDIRSEWKNIPSMARP